MTTSDSARPTNGTRAPGGRRHLMVIVRPGGPEYGSGHLHGHPPASPLLEAGAGGDRAGRHADRPRRPRGRLWSFASRRVQMDLGGAVHRLGERPPSGPLRRSRPTAATTHPAAPALSSAASGVACGTKQPDHDHSRYGRPFKQNYTIIRSGPSTDCKRPGQGQRSHRVDYHCYVWGADGKSWTYLRDVTTGKRGYVRDDLLKGNGSSVPC